MLDGIYLSTHQGRFVDVNPAFVRMFRYSNKQEILSIKDIKKEFYFAPEERGSHLLDTGKEEVEVYRMRRKDGAEIWVEDHGRYVHDEAGNIVLHEGILRDVTERKRLEDELKEYSSNLEKLVDERTRKLTESERRFRDFVDLLPLSAFEADASGKLAFVNQAATTTTGYTPEDVRKGIDAFQLIVPEQHSTLTMNIRKILGGEKLPPHEYTVRRKDGSLFSIVLDTAPIVREGKAIGIRGVAQDVTEEKRMHNELQAASERLEYIITSNPAAIYTGKPSSGRSDWYLTYISDRVDSLLGFDSRQFTDLEFWRSHIHPDDRDPTRLAMARILKEGVGSVEYRFLAGDGNYRWLREEAKVNYDQSGKPIEVNGYLTDITQLKRSEEAIRESEARYRRIFESSPISLWEEDFSRVKQYFDSLRRDGVTDLREHFKEHPDELSRCASMVRILDVNETTLKLYGARSVNELRGELRRVFTQESKYNFGEELASLWDGKMSFTSEFDNRTLAGVRIHVSLILNVIPGYEDTLAKVIVSIIDLTERREMEKRLQQSERLAAVGETAAMVGHDLRNPLQSIAGALHLLKDGKLSEDERAEMLRVIEASLEYSDVIIRDLSEYAAEIQLKLSDETPRALISEALSTLKVPDNITVQNSSWDHPTLRVDRDSLRRVFINLIQNAIDAMPQGGLLSITSTETDGKAEIVLSDSGTGMSEEVLQNLWKPLKTTKAKGLGLGLAICKRIVDAHGGSMSVESKVGEGTRTTVCLPIREEGAEVNQK